MVIFNAVGSSCYLSLTAATALSSAWLSLSLVRSLSGYLVLRGWDNWAVSSAWTSCTWGGSSYRRSTITVKGHWGEIEITNGLVQETCVCNGSCIGIGLVSVGSTPSGGTNTDKSWSVQNVKAFWVGVRACFSAITNCSSISLATIWVRLAIDDACCGTARLTVRSGHCVLGLCLAGRVAGRRTYSTTWIVISALSVWCRSTAHLVCITLSTCQGRSCCDPITSLIRVLVCIDSDCISLLGDLKDWKRIISSGWAGVNTRRCNIAFGCANNKWGLPCGHDGGVSEVLIGSVLIRSGGVGVTRDEGSISKSLGGAVGEGLGLELLS